MNRKILFRGKRVDNGEWAYGYLFKSWNRVFLLWEMTGDVPNMEEVKPETVGQYTGLTDKNGNKIFEGDIVYNGVFKAQVEFINGRFSPFGSDIFFADECEVIGNIHDNKELLK